MLTFVVSITKNYIMSKAKQIAEFIRTNNPRRKDIVKFIVVNVNKKVSEKNYDPKNFLGYYSTNFAQWKRNKKVSVDAKHRYSLTDQYEKYGRLYSMSDETLQEYRSKRVVRESRAHTPTPSIHQIPPQITNTKLFNETLEEAKKWKTLYTESVNLSLKYKLQLEVANRKINKISLLID
jgi:hypothetical protein